MLKKYVKKCQKILNYNYNLVRKKGAIIIIIGEKNLLQKSFNML